MPWTLTRSILAVLVPGLVATAPWLLLLASGRPGVSQLYKDYQVLANAVLFATIVAVGSVIEGIGSSFEARWDKEREGELGVQANWNAYLARVSDPEPVGHRYLTRMVTAMYFELGMMIAAPALIAGVTRLLAVSQVAVYPWGYVAATIAALGAAYYFYGAARQSHRVLCEVRRELAERLDRTPAARPGDSPSEAGRDR
jgi:predicted Co/Zn/Cd cation transporter (cation efflux family)